VARQAVHRLHEVRVSRRQPRERRLTLLRRRRGGPAQAGGARQSREGRNGTLAAVPAYTPALDSTGRLKGTRICMVTALAFALTGMLPRTVPSDHHDTLPARMARADSAAVLPRLRVATGP
jgi:hypothetical protein